MNVASQVDSSAEGGNFHIELHPQTVDYELVTENKPISQHNLDEEPGLKNRNDDVAQYEDIKGQDSTGRGQNTYEGLSDEVRYRLRIMLYKKFVMDIILQK